MNRTVEYTSKARQKLEAQIAYIVEQGATRPAEDLRNRIAEYEINHLAVFPGSGKAVPNETFYEAWISGTRLVLWYEFDDDKISVIDVWHTSQHRG